MKLSRSAHALLAMKVVMEDDKAILHYATGKTILGRLVGQMMVQSDGLCDTAVATEELIRLLGPTLGTGEANPAGEQ